MARWYLAQGSSDAYIVPVVDESGAAIVCTGTEPLSAVVWPGGAREPSFPLIPTWQDAASGLTLVTIPSTLTVDLTPQTYTVECTITDGVGPRRYYAGWLEITPSPDTESEPPSYCTYQDLLDYAAWIPDLQAESDQAGFARQRGRAREWLDEVILSRYGPDTSGSYLMGMPPPLVSSAPSAWLRDQLAADHLIVRGPVREIAAKRALYLICSPQLGKRGEYSYQDLARRYERETEELVKLLWAEIDTDGDGLADVTVRCGVTSLS